MYDSLDEFFQRGSVPKPPKLIEGWAIALG